MEEIESQLRNFLSIADAEVEELRAAFASTSDEVVSVTSAGAEAERQANVDAQAIQDRFQSRVRELAEGRVRRANAQATECGAEVAEMEGELLAMGERLPDVGQCSLQLAEVRDCIEAQRLQRQEAGNKAARDVEGKLKSLREELSAEAASLARLRDIASRRLQEGLEEAQAKLGEETAQRKARHGALVEVVHRLQTSLEASVEIEEPSAASFLRMTPTRTPGERSTTRKSLWGGSNTATPANSTPRRSLPAPPAMTGRER